ncbi:MAG: hypothetical protein B7Z02_07145 [Rhodobacterales bacterium 32-67-9]|nr:MAG: hypothetical protein B7Z02_07145 [Rhodobacterales bacterium 32-67-9]
MARAQPTCVPSIDEDACSRGILVRSACAACAASCPHDALSADEDGLYLEPADCTGCGACLAACPRQAISLDSLDAIVIEPSGGSPVAALICPRRAVGYGPCLQSLGLESLSRLWLGGVRRIVTLTAGCADCPDGRSLAVADRVADLNDLLADRGLPLLRVEPAQSVAKSVPKLMARAADHAGRRAFLGLGAASAEADGPSESALSRLQSLPAGPDARAAFAPRIDPRICTGCDACVRICPEGALTLIKDESGIMVYRTSPTKCTSCGLCMDVCGADAIRIDRQAPRVPDLRLTGYRCRGCGVEVHSPAGGPWDGGEAGGGLCPICAATSHHKRLFQVLP